MPPVRFLQSKRRRRNRETLFEDTALRRKTALEQGNPLRGFLYELEYNSCTRKGAFMISDYHVHTLFSTDSEALPEEHITKAIALGMKEICFTDHIDYDYPPQNDSQPFTFEPDEYFARLSALRDKYASLIKIKIGVELGLNPQCDIPNRQLVNGYPFDFVIGSSHLVDGGDPYYAEFWQDKSISECITAYYEAVLRNVTLFNDYDVYGHLDYIRRYVPDKSFVYVDADYRDILDMILKNIISKGHGIELNTRELSNGLTHFIPTIALLKRYRELGGEIVTVGSDAHITKNIGYAFATARDILLNSGFKYVTTFEKRMPTYMPL